LRIQITGRHVGVTEAMKEYAREKVEKLEKIYGRMTKVEVTLDADHARSIVEIVASANRHVRLVGKAESPDMYAAVDLAEEKLARQLVKHKQRLTDHHRGDLSMGSLVDGTVSPEARAGAPGSATAPGAAEETYDDVIDRLSRGGDGDE
jgi:putative sigma-54 modulation protein